MDKDLILLGINECLELREVNIIHNDEQQQLYDNLLQLKTELQTIGE